VRSPFELVLSKAAADAESDKRHNGDAAHLARWLHDGRADEIWQKFYPGAFDANKAYSFIIVMLSFRQLAEHFDRANQQVSAAKKARKKATAADMIKLIREMSAQGVLITDVRDGALDSVETLEPILAVRSDERGARRQTIFCRLASMYVHAPPRWHDEQVAALCEIALNCKDVTADMVRSAREAGRRDARRKKRAPKR
jgi:hypothetical protein